MNLGVIFAEGKGVEAAQDRAIHWFKRAAELGDATAMFNLALAYQAGNGVDRCGDRGVEGDTWHCTPSC